MVAVFGGELLERRGNPHSGGNSLRTGCARSRTRLARCRCRRLARTLFWFTVGRAIQGRRLGPDSPSFKARVAQVKRLIEARPVTAILLLQYLYGLRLVGAVALGLTDLSLLRFALYQVINCLIWAGLIGGVAYLLGGLVIEIFHGWFRWIWMVASASVVVVLL